MIIPSLPLLFNIKRRVIFEFNQISCFIFSPTIKRKIPTVLGPTLENCFDNSLITDLQVSDLSKVSKYF